MLCVAARARGAGAAACAPPPGAQAGRSAVVRAAASRRWTVTVVPHSAGCGGDHVGDSGAQAHPDPSRPLYPGYQEEKDVSHEAFMHALEASRPRAMSIPGMQEFAASIWNRRRSIPSQTYSDPLDHIFTEFDANGDGRLSADEISRALASRGVAATEAQVALFIDAADSDGDGEISRADFPNFVFHMASADLRSATSMAARPPSPTANGGQ